MFYWTIFLIIICLLKKIKKYCLVTNKMSRQYYDTTGQSVGSPSCAYATLSNYNKQTGGMNAPMPTGNSTPGVQVVPAYGAPGYGTLMHGAAPSCSGYPTINNAYRNNGGSCNQQYVKKLCN